MVAARKRKLFALSDTFGLTRDERLELACYLLRRDITSWKDLNDHQVCRLLDALEGTELLLQLISMRA